MARQSILPVLLVDDEEQILRIFEMTLNSAGIGETIRCTDSRKVVSIMAEQEMAAVILDLSMPHLTGQDLLSIIREAFPEIPVIIVTGANEIKIAVECMKAGAYDYILKPPDEGQLISSVHRAIEVSRLRYENQALRESFLAEDLKRPECFAEIITDNPSVKAMFRYIEAVAGTGEPILITGETGVGKELVARAIHASSDLDGPFVAVNVAGLDDNAFSDTLFGHKKGAFTGADERRQGLIREASGGTLFLDEIGDLGMPVQVKLLRLLQEHEYFPLGSDVPQLSDARILAATNHDIEKDKDEGRFRADLFYRFRTHQVHVPPLRDRTGDVPVLAEHFLRKAAEKLGKEKPRIAARSLSHLGMYNFPGNVRELESMVIDAVSNHTSGTLSIKVPGLDVSRLSVMGMPPGSVATEAPFAALPTLPSLKDVADLLVDEALKRSDGNQSLAAKVLGVSQPALSQRLKKRATGQQ